MYFYSLFYVIHSLLSFIQSHRSVFNEYYKTVFFSLLKTILFLIKSNNVFETKLSNLFFTFHNVLEKYDILEIIDGTFDFFLTAKIVQAE